MSIRPDAAAKEIRLALAEDPDNSYGHAILALCLLDLKRPDEAFSEAKEAIRLGADESFSFYVLARCHFDADRTVEAEVAIEEALNIEPLNADYLWMLALIQLTYNDLKGTLETTEKGLSVDASHAHCHNLRAYVLGKLGRESESDHSANTALELEPDDAVTHAMRGWSLLERHDHERSLHHFREALRLNPDLDWARQGLIAALPSKHWMFKLHLRLKNKLCITLLLLWMIVNFVYMQYPTTGDAQTMFFVGMTLSWLGFVLFAFIIFLPDGIISGPVMKFLLQFEPDGRHILTPDERKSNNHTVVFLSLVILFLILGTVTHVWYPLWITFVAFFLSRPVFLPGSERTGKCWVWHVVGATVTSLLMWFVCSGGETFVYRGLRAVVWINVFKVLLGAKTLKIVGGLFGAGLLAQGLRTKQKEEARKKMLEDI